MVKKVKLKNLRHSIRANIFMSKNTKTTYTKISYTSRPFKLGLATTEWKVLRDSLTKGYNPKVYGYLQVQNNVVINGNHRLMLLKDLYPENHEIEVETIIISYFRQFLNIVGTVIILTLIVLSMPLKLIKNRYKNKL